MFFKTYKNYYENWLKENNLIHENTIAICKELTENSIFNYSIAKNAIEYLTERNYSVNASIELALEEYVTSKVR